MDVVWLYGIEAQHTGLAYKEPVRGSLDARTAHAPPRELVVCMYTTCIVRAT